MLLLAEPEIIAHEDENLDEFIYRIEDIFGAHSVSIFVPPASVRTEADKLRAKTLAETALANAIAKGKCSVHLSLGW